MYVGYKAPLSLSTITAWVMPSSQLNCDIWCEVLKLLRHEQLDASSSHHSYYKVRACRKAILSIALTSINLVDIALSALWWDVSTLEPIVRVINAFATDGLFVSRQVVSSKGVWVGWLLPSLITLKD